MNLTDIRKLAELAGAKDVDLANPEIVAVLEKFSDLIVQECITLLENEKNKHIDSLPYSPYKSIERFNRLQAKEDIFNGAINSITAHFRGK